jgi:hypothetical protein
VLAPEFTTAQAAKVAGVTAFTMRQWVARGHVKRKRNGLIDGETLLNYLDRRTGTGRPKRERD